MIERYFDTAHFWGQSPSVLELPLSELVVWESHAARIGEEIRRASGAG